MKTFLLYCFILLLQLNCQFISNSSFDKSLTNEITIKGSSIQLNNVNIFHLFFLFNKIKGYKLENNKSHN